MASVKLISVIAIAALIGCGKSAYVEDKPAASVGTPAPKKVLHKKQKTVLSKEGEHQHGCQAQTPYSEPDGGLCGQQGDQVQTGQWPVRPTNPDQH